VLEPVRHPFADHARRRGWRAVYRYENRVVLLPVVCWVLTEYCGGTRAVLGWVPEGKFIDQADSDSYDGFDGYLEPGSAAPTVSTQASLPSAQSDTESP